MILSALPALSYAQVKNIVTGEYSAVSKIITEKETLYPSDKILLVFDIDNTLLTRAHALAVISGINGKPINCP